MRLYGSMSRGRVSCEEVSSSSCSDFRPSSEDGSENVVQPVFNTEKSALKYSMTGHAAAEVSGSWTNTSVLSFLVLLSVAALVILKRRSIIVPATVNRPSSVMDGVKGVTAVISTPSTAHPVRRKKKAITIIVERPIAPLLAALLTPEDFVALRNARVRASDSSKWSIILLETMARDPLVYHRIHIVSTPRNMLRIGAEEPAARGEDVIVVSTERSKSKPGLTLSLPDAHPDHSPMLEPIDSSTSDASPVASGEKNSSWNLDKRPSLSSLSSASFPTNSNNQTNEPRRMTWDAKEQLTLAAELNKDSSATSAAAVSSKRRRARRSRQRSKSLTGGPTSLAVDASVPVIWPVYNPNGLPPAPPPGLVFRPPPGLDPPRRILRADAPTYTPLRVTAADMSPPLSFSLAAPPPPYPLTPTSRSERSSTLASVRSSRTTSSDGDIFIHDMGNVNRFMRGTPTDDGHDADDEEESYYDEERPSVDLSFLE
jgi:hypothetical protein